MSAARAVLAGLALSGALAGCAAPPAGGPPPVMPSVQAPPQPAPEVVPTAAPAPPPAPVLAGHVASYKTMAEAEAAWPRLAERFPMVGQEPKRFVEIDLGPQRGKVVRLLVGGFSDREKASQFCHKLKGSGAYCVPHDLPPEKS